MTATARRVVGCTSCHAKMFWARSASTDRPIPIDAEPAPDRGNVYLDDQGRAVAFDRRDGVPQDALGRPLYVSHFATCPDAARHRKKAGAR